MEAFACSVCSRILGFAEALPTTVCRQHRSLLGPVRIHIRKALPADRDRITKWCLDLWGHTDIVACGHTYPVETLAALLAESESAESAGLCCYGFEGESAILVVLQVAPGYQRRGVGSRLLTALEARLSDESPVRRIEVSTTNDNLPALYFYQRHGYRIVEVRPGAVQNALSSKFPAGVIGYGGIPVRDEIRLTRELVGSPHG